MQLKTHHQFVVSRLAGKILTRQVEGNPAGHWDDDQQWLAMTSND